MLDVLTGLSSFGQYIYGIYLGFNGEILPEVRLTPDLSSLIPSKALPFLIRTELLLSPLLPLFTGYILTLLGFNVAKHVLEAYFGS